MLSYARGRAFSSSAPVTSAGMRGLIAGARFFSLDKGGLFRYTRSRKRLRSSAYDDTIALLVFPATRSEFLSPRIRGPGR
jgi:hypothetical protein